MNRPDRKRIRLTEDDLTELQPLLDLYGFRNPTQAVRFLIRQWNIQNKVVPLEPTLTTDDLPTDTDDDELTGTDAFLALLAA